MTFHLMFSSVWVAEWLTRLTIHVCYLCISTKFSYFLFLVRGLDLGSDCFSSWYLPTFHFFHNI